MKDTILPSTMATAKRAIKKIEAETGERVDDWLWECAEIAEEEWYDEESDCYDVEAITSQIMEDADTYIDFFNKTYREEW